MENAELIKQVRSAVIAALSGQSGSGEAAKEALHLAFVSCLNGDRGSQPSPDKVRCMARAGLEALLLANASAVDGSVDVMQAVVEASSRLNFDMEFMMRSALLGLADVGRRAPGGATYAVKAALEETFSGLGEAFDQALQQVAATSPL